MNRIRLFVSVALGFGLATAASAQCTTYEDLSEIVLSHLLASKSPPYIDKPLACVAEGGRVRWRATPGDTVTIKFPPGGSPLDSENPGVDHLWDVKGTAGHSYTYSFVLTYNSVPHSVTDLHIQIGPKLSSSHTAASSGSTKCNKDTANVAKAITLSISPTTHQLTLGADDKVCMYNGAFILWDQDPAYIKAWTLVFKKDKAVPKIPVWSDLDAENANWQNITCPGCNQDGGPLLSHKYQVVAIGKDGTLYRIDPDIIVEPGSGPMTPPLDGTKKKK